MRQTGWRGSREWCRGGQEGCNVGPSVGGQEQGVTQTTLIKTRCDPPLFSTRRMLPPYCETQLESQTSQG